MDKNDLAKLRKEFKAGNDGLKLGEICSVYIKKDNAQILGVETEYFEQMDELKQEFYLKGFKKLITGQLDSKIFELSFADNKLGENPEQKVLFEALNSDFKEQIGHIVKKIIDHSESYESDYMISFTRGEFWIPAKNEVGEDDAAKNDVVNAFQFMMGTVNLVSSPKRALMFDFEEKNFRVDIPMNVYINAVSPEEGFVFPSMSDGYADTNKVIYYTKKDNQPSESFIHHVLNCELVPTAQDDKERFLTIIKDVAGDQVEPEVIANVYEQISECILDADEDGEIPTLGVKAIEQILVKSGIEDTRKLESSFLVNTEKANYEFKATNLLPSSKVIEIKSNVAQIKIRHEDLKRIKQVKRNGRQYLLIEIDDPAILEGFELSTEEF
ncbi:DUF4317 domain-containing protein [Desulfosporosinus sp. FKB]|uniref:DUF4317 domain-containing protein n=1 Tax=Desulfosporosinus sp. FKB TaxID=1969835 RepID=UPI000B498F37|nr:DUF4317 domain-containing protein [Desulfosporosinus sp. FKB]